MDTATRPGKPAHDGLTREQLDKMTAEQRQQRRMRLYSAPGVVNLAGFAKLGGLSTASATRFRSNFLKTGQTTANAAPAPDPDVNSAGIRQPADPPDVRRTRGDSAVWKIRTALAWLVWSQRTDEDFVPNPDGRPRSGRPADGTTPTPVPGHQEWLTFLADLEVEVGNWESTSADAWARGDAA